MRKIAVLISGGVLLVITTVIVCEQPWRWNDAHKIVETRKDVANQVLAVKDHRFNTAEIRMGPVSRAYILAVLSEISMDGPRDDLSKPTICDAYFCARHNSVDGYLLLCWVERYPTPDSVRVIWRDGTKEDFAISPEQIAQNQLDSLREVLYDARIQCAPGSTEEKKMLATPHPSVVLVKNGIEECPPADVDVVEVPKL